ncbi:adenosylcobinamide amidohydrolase [Roseixanthobacter pseudopolyaromaticivorans]|uniref:adenosylcobinamide amidohydrolase n=1 Tax=Xanthobacteraceae TaxID=335928 RepID=UPI0037279E7D
MSLPADCAPGDLAAARAFTIACARPWLVARFAAPRRMVSWSLNRPGFVDAHEVAWLEVRNADLTPGLDPARWFADRLAEAGHANAVGMMTARNVACHHHACASVDGVQAECLITLGLNNGERIGQRVTTPWVGPGTINILCDVSVPLHDAALLEAASLVTQARTVAIIGAGYRRAGMRESVTGTGTDCVVLSSPPGRSSERFAGMHTAVGEAVGAAILRAMDAALNQWLAQNSVTTDA